jgi:hypothetical protein
MLALDKFKPNPADFIGAASNEFGQHCLLKHGRMPVCSLLCMPK